MKRLEPAATAAALREATDSTAFDVRNATLKPQFWLAAASDPVTIANFAWKPPRGGCAGPVNDMDAREWIRSLVFALYETADRAPRA
jgi:hypothetical protein